MLVKYKGILIIIFGIYTRCLSPSFSTHLSVFSNQIINGFRVYGIASQMNQYLKRKLKWKLSYGSCLMEVLYHGIKTRYAYDFPLCFPHESLMSLRNITSKTSNSKFSLSVKLNIIGLLMSTAWQSKQNSLISCSFTLSLQSLCF